MIFFCLPFEMPFENHNDEEMKKTKRCKFDDEVNLKKK